MNFKSSNLWSFAAVLLAAIYFWHVAYNTAYATDIHDQFPLINTVNLIFHEAGHTIFGLFGMFIKIAAGSGLQILLPLLISIYFFVNQQKVSGSIVLMWVGQNFLDVSRYAGDAILMQLDLLGGDSVIHDWNYLLSTTNLLRYAPYIASDMFVFGILLIALGTILGIYFSIKKQEVI